MRKVQVYINGFIMYETMVEPIRSLMVGHQLQKIWCIDQLNNNGIDAGVLIVKEDGGTIAVTTVAFNKNAITVQSAINAEGFEEKSEWWDDILNRLPEKNENES